MASKTRLVVTHDLETTADLKSFYQATNDQIRKEAALLQKLIEEMGSGARNGSFSVTIDDGNEAAAHSTLTVSGGAAADTAVINGTTLTCVDHRETSDVAFVADVAGSLNNTYFTFQDQSGAHKYYVWFNINSAGVDPAVAGRTGIQVAGATGATAATLATAAVAACASAVGVQVSAGAAGHIIITDLVPGLATAVADGVASTGFTFTRSITGSAVTSSQYNVATTDALTAANLSAAINANSTINPYVLASVVNAVVTVTAQYVGILGNAITLAATAGVTAGAARLAGGLEATNSTLVSYAK